MSTTESPTTKPPKYLLLKPHIVQASLNPPGGTGRSGPICTNAPYNTGELS